MGAFKKLGSVVASAGLTACGGLAVLTAIGGIAFARPGLAAPEIDPSSIVSAVTLLLGSAMLLTGRRLTK
jgi:hypothetical protein